MAGQVISKIKAGDGSTNLLTSSFYGTCNTAAATAAKEVIVNDPAIVTAITLITGMTLAVNFTYANGVASPTITVFNNRGTAAAPTKGSTTLIAAKPIMRYGTTATSTNAATSWRNGAMVLFVYNGTNWVEVSSIDDNSDTKVKIVNTNPATLTTYYPIWHTGTGTSQVSANDGFKYLTMQGTDEENGEGVIELGNNIDEETAGNKTGILRLFSHTTKYAQLLAAGSTTNTTHYLPSVGGTIHNSNTLTGGVYVGPSTGTPNSNDKIWIQP